MKTTKFSIPGQSICPKNESSYWCCLPGSMVTIIVLACIVLSSCRKMDTKRDNSIDSLGNSNPDAIVTKGETLFHSSARIYVLKEMSRADVKLLNDSMVQANSLVSFDKVNGSTTTQAYVSEINPGDFLLAQKGPGTPQGLLVKVLTKTTTGTFINLSIVNAGVEQIIEKIDLDWHWKVPTIKENFTKEITIPIGSSGIKCTLSGSFLLNIKNSLSFVVTNGQIRKAQFYDTINSEVKIESFLGFQDAIQFDSTVFLKEISLINSGEIKIGELKLPLVVTATLQIHVRAKASGRMGISGQIVHYVNQSTIHYGYEMNQEPQMGAQWLNGHFDTANVKSKLEGTFRAGLATEVKFNFFKSNKTGVTAGLELYGQLDGKCSDTGLVLTGTVGVDALIGGEIDLFFSKPLKKNINIPVYKKEMFQFHPKDDTLCILPPPPPKDSANSSGDTHLGSFDRRYYDLQGKGEFLGLQSSVDNLLVQVRQSDLPSYTSHQVTFNTAIAARSGTETVAFTVQPLKLHVNGIERSMSSTIRLGQNGSILFQGRRVTIIFGSGDRIKISYYNQGYLDYQVLLTDKHKNNITGLFGNYDGNAANDVTLKNGTLVNPLSFSAMYPAFANSWRITQNESLFVYASGTSTQTFTDVNFPTALPNPTTQQFQTAQNACRVAGITTEPALGHCIYDVAVTGNNEFIESALNTQSSFVSEGLVLYMPMDGNANDKSGYGHDGQIFNGVTGTTNRHGQANSALHFNGSGSYISVANTPGIMSLTSEVTVTAWVNFENWYSGWGSVVCKSRGELNRIQFQLRSNAMYLDNASVAVNPPLQLNQWYHVAFVIKGNERRIYLNGNLLGTSTNGLTLTPNNSVLDIGRDYIGQDEYMIGKMDEFRVYSKALTDAEIAAIFNL